MKLHIGSGPNILKGWLNIDEQHFPQLSEEEYFQFDLRKPMPFTENSVDFIYSEHFIEHVPLEDGKRIFKDCFKFLKPGGVFRIATPDLKILVEAYLVKNTPPYYVGTGWHPATPCQLLNEGVRYWGHQFIYDEEELTDTLRSVGFGNVYRAEYNKSKYIELNGIESRPNNPDLIVEAVK